MTINTIALETTDASVWASEFCKEYSVFTDDGVISDEEGLMLAWFASAIERGRDAGARDSDAEFKRSARCETCNAPIGPTDMQYWTGGAVWCEAHAPAWAFDEDNSGSPTAGDPMTATETIYNGASREAWEAFDSVKPPHVQWGAWTGYTNGLRAYRLQARRIGSGAICGPMGSDAVATVIFDQNGDFIPTVERERLESENARRDLSGWRMAANSVNAISDLLRALARC